VQPWPLLAAPVILPPVRPAVEPAATIEYAEALLAQVETIMLALDGEARMDIGVECDRLSSLGETNDPHAFVADHPRQSGDNRASIYLARMDILEAEAGVLLAPVLAGCDPFTVVAEPPASVMAVGRDMEARHGHEGRWACDMVIATTAVRLKRDVASSMTRARGWPRPRP
jgi:hypothetical protein